MKSKKLNALLKVNSKKAAKRAERVRKNKEFVQAFGAFLKAQGVSHLWCDSHNRHITFSFNDDDRWVDILGASEEDDNSLTVRTPGKEIKHRF